MFIKNMLDVLKNRYIYFGISLFIIFFSLSLIFLKKLNLGIDMTGGTQAEFNYSGSIELEKIQNEILQLKKDFNQNHNNVINSISVYKVSGENKIIIETGFENKLDEKTLEKFKNNFKELCSEKLYQINNTFLLDRYVNIGKSFGDYIKKTAIITLIIALVAITIYIGFAFFGIAIGINSLSFAFITLITLFHDIIVASGFYIFTSIFYLEFKIDTFFITALLTILGYSINDTIVIFDRIRDNIKKYVQTKKLYEIINISINETLTRSIYTSLTLIFVLIAIFLFGPESLKGFMLVMIYGVVFGTYSSIFIASPLLYEINKNKVLKVYKEKEISDKIVV